MKYIIMCGGKTCTDKKPKHLFQYKDKTIVERTIDLLRKCGVEDIAITTSPNCVDKFNMFGVEVIPHEANNRPYTWVDAFYFIEEPVCYIFGDVVYSTNAIKTIVETETDSIEFFASAPPFARNYPKRFAEPFAFKVVDNKRFRECVLKTKECKKQGIWHREPISWELWQIIKDTRPNHIVYDNYVAINDYTCDVDNEWELNQWNNI